ncbi:MAG TPA: NAD(P)-dependent oxidoreductase [Anaerolineales bacterium]|nr:NAD(P)-dependent oxidoreductase [Anaerolineales bacterium]
MPAIASEFLAIDRKARARIPSLDVATRPVSDRVCDFDDVVIPMDAEQAMLEAARCVHCPDPAPCVEACPAHNDIPSAMWLIEQGEFLEAARIYRQTSSLPEICGRVCPQEQLCQGSCTHQKSQHAVLTGPLEAFVTCYERRVVGVEIPKGEPTGRKVAIVGAGPSGIACAEQLIQRGHTVTIFDSKPAPGGLLTYGIPNFKLPKEVVFQRWGDFNRAGVEFVPETYIGKDKTLDDLFAEGYEAVFVGVGVGVDAPMEVPGEDLPGVMKATEFLIRCCLDDEQLLPRQLRGRPEIGSKLVVIGGGDTASDCLRTALRLGAKEVTCLYRRTEKEMPGGRHDRELAKEEGARYEYLTQPVRFIAGENGHLKALECIRMELGEPDKSGRRRPVPIEGTNFIVEADTAVLALGYWPDPVIGESTPGLETRNWGLIVTDSNTGATSRPGVFAGGDVVTGPDLVVTAMVAGRKAATAIDAYLKEKK